ncbi:MAG: carboxylating nicotinate-nucleotide diphosphorylase [Deltaproteobacteria bacterium]|nr:carboxylating nicotinate-nucleotide diphosphorylase [Deltaproteobacteria bacterium]
MKIDTFTKKIIAQSLKEDCIQKDPTSRLLIPPQLNTKAFILAKEDLVLCGLFLAKEVFRQVDPKIECKILIQEGQWVKKGNQVLKIQGNARSILAGERVALNFLQRLSGIATLTKKYVEAIEGSPAKILDTRKTTPTLRNLERYAVRVGGGVNHRFDLSQSIMVKDNHRALSGNLTDILEKLKKAKVPVIIEVETLKELQEALAAGARYLQLDNMKLKQLKNCVDYVRQIKGTKIILEATGGINLKNAGSIAKTGVDYLSIGALTHSAKAVDLSLEIS